MHNPGTLAYQANLWVREYISSRCHDRNYLSFRRHCHLTTSILQVMHHRREKITTYRKEPVPGIYHNDPKTGKWFLIGIKLRTNISKELGSKLFIAIGKPASLPSISSNLGNKLVNMVSCLHSEQQKNKIDPFDVYQVDGFRCLKNPLEVEFIKVLDRWMFSAEVKYRTKTCSVTSTAKRAIKSPQRLKEHEFFCMDDSYTWIRRCNSRGHELDGPFNMYAFDEESKTMRRQCSSEIARSIQYCCMEKRQQYLSAYVRQSPVDVMNTMEIMRLFY